MDSAYEPRREVHRGLFGSDVDAYAQGRPGYPDALYELLRRRCGLGRATRVLEIGPGAGQATAVLLDHGAHVVAVELDERFAAPLRRVGKGSALDVVIGPFEDVEVPAASFDLAVAGTAFHWVPPDAGLLRIAAALRPGGWLGLWWNCFGDPERPDPFHDAIQPMLATLAPELVHEGAGSDVRAEVHPHALDVAARTAEIEATGEFGRVHHDVFSWTGRHSAQEIRRMFSTFSSWIALESSRREAALDALHDIAVTDFHGVVERPYLTAVYSAQRR